MQDQFPEIRNAKRGTIPQRNAKNRNELYLLAARNFHATENYLRCGTCGAVHCRFFSAALFGNGILLAVRNFHVRISWNGKTLRYQCCVAVTFLWKSRLSTFFQTFHHRRPSFSGCRLTGLELTTRNSHFDINTAVVPAPIKNFFISTILYLLAL